MNAPKAFASLSGGLLARKGSARPAMRRQNYGQVGPNGLDDLGWNDMGSEPVPLNEEGGNVESISRNPLSGLTPSQPVVHDQQAKLAQQFGADEDDGEDYSDDHADLDDSTAELWDPEADESPNVFTGHRDARKSDALTAPASYEAADEYEAVEAEEAVEATEEIGFDKPPVSQSMFSHKTQALTPPEDFGAQDEPAAEEEDLDAPQLMRTVADLMPLTEAQRAEGGAWGDEDEAALDAAEPTPVPADVAAALTGAGADDEDDLYGEEEEATAEEAAGEDFDPTAANRFGSLITRPARDPAPADDWDDGQSGDLSAAPAFDEADEDELLLGADMVAEPAQETVAPVFETREVTSYDVAQAKAGAKDKAAFTLRLDRERHLKLRLACALTGQSAQKMVTDALDRLLAEMTELDELVDQANAKKGG